MAADIELSVPMAEVTQISPAEGDAEDPKAIADGGLVLVEPVASAAAEPIATVTYQVPLGKWQTGLFDCCTDVPICCYVAFCYWCAFGHVMAAHDDDKTCRDECCNVVMWDVCNGCFGAYYHSIKRAKIRQNYGGLPEEPCDVSLPQQNSRHMYLAYSYVCHPQDCKVSCFCGPCALCQEGRQAKAGRPNWTGCLGM